MIEKVRIGAVDYTVSLDSRLTLMRDSVGEVNSDLCEINIEKSIAPQIQYQSVLHEITHAILKHSGISLGDIEEQAVDVLSYGMLQVIRDNPQLIREIQELWSV